MADCPKVARGRACRPEIQVSGKTIKYTATVGTLRVKNAENKPTGEVVFISYILEGANRPVTFAFNGGPGAASVYLNLGAIGPKRVAFGTGESPSDPATLTDNPGTSLDFTDLVFIDPIGTGFSQSLVSPDETRKLFYGPDQDIVYLSRIVYDWLVKNSRLQSRKYLVGESYGGYRGAALDTISAIHHRGGDQWLDPGFVGAETRKRVCRHLSDSLDADASFHCRGEL